VACGRTLSYVSAHGPREVRRVSRTGIGPLEPSDPILLGAGAPHSIERARIVGMYASGRRARAFAVQQIWARSSRVRQICAQQTRADQIRDPETRAPQIGAVRQSWGRSRSDLTIELPPPILGRYARILLLLPALVGLASACVTRYEVGSNLYREGDLRGALETWRGIQPGEADHELAKTQITVVEAEFGRMLRRYEKRAEFYERENRLAEALLSYRLALKLAPDQPTLLARVQTLVRKLDKAERETLATMRTQLQAGKLKDANESARQLEELNPFNPSLQVDVRQVRAALGERVLRYLEEGKAEIGKAIYADSRERARTNFQRVLDLDPKNKAALGYLSYLEELTEARKNARGGDGSEVATQMPTPAQSEILAEGHYTSARRAERNGDPFAALVQYDQALRLNPKHPRAGAARDDLRAQLQPKIDELEARAKRYFQEEDLQNAVLMWRRVLLIQPRRESAAYNLARAERMLARLEELQAGESGS